MPRRPNILWIMTDEQRADTLGCYGNAWARTPNVDRLAAGGVTFDCAIVQNPVCVPSRVSMLASRYARTVGTMRNIDRLDTRGLVFLPEVLFQAGYETLNIGRIDCLRGRVDRRRQEGMVGFYGGHMGKARRPALSTFRPELTGPERAQALGVTWPPADREVGARTRERVMLYGTYPGPVADTLEAIHTDMAIDYLQTRTDDRPFFLRVSHLSPHTPVLPPAPFDRLYTPDQARVADPPAEALARKSSAERAHRDLFHLDRASEDVRARYRAHYYGLAAHVDGQVGRLLDALRDLGLEQDTVVVYNTDHGSMVGQMGGLVTKGPFDYDHTNRVPLLLSWPGTLPAGARVADPVEMVDLYPTLLGLAGVDAPSGLHGMDLGPVVRGRAPGRDAAFSEGGDGNPDRPDSPGMRYTVRTRTHKLTAYPALGQGVLYDLAADPQEIDNRFDDPALAEVRAALLGRILDWLEQYPGKDWCTDRAGVARLAG